MMVAFSIKGKFRKKKIQVVFFLTGTGVHEKAYNGLGGVIA
jgi:hypothetical protein